MLNIDIRNGVPLYKQIVEGMKEKIIKGDIKADAKVTSIRALASDLRINPNTIKKAYTVLEQEGFLYSINGRGSFVKPLEDKQRKAQHREIEKLLQDAVIKAKLNNMGQDELKDLIEVLYKEKTND